MRLGMSLIVRDEADIIAENIAFHAKMGVDAFAVIDNGSKDGTREILENLSSSYDLDLFDDRGPFEQERQATFLAHHLSEHQNAGWVISNDADEFWLPKSGNLKSLIDPSRPVLAVERRNILPRKADVADPSYRFYYNVMLVDKPYGQHPPSPDPNQPLLFQIMLRTLPQKVVCELDGLQSISKGNHHIRHDAGPPRPTDDALIFHYQIRSYKNFDSKIRNHGERLHQAPDGQSWHLRRWHGLYLAGRLRDEYESLLLDREDAQKLLAAGVINETRIIADLFCA